MSEPEQIDIKINDREVTTTSGRLLIDVAEDNDIFIPRFCYHPGMDPVAACRMCLVEIEGSRKPLDPACVTYVNDGMEVRTDSEVAVEAQESVLEMLLINHPLDCPICDRGGECPLQDQTLKFGPGSSRYSDPKRHFTKPIEISELVLLDRERCVLCWRCVRFSEEIAGDPFIDLMDRGSLTQINTAEDHPFDSHFSGNTIQICPVGALTASDYRFESRPWDLTSASSMCSYCSVGCPISLEQRGGEVLRAQALPNEHVNSFWVCDKGRFGHTYISAEDRLKTPLIRKKTAEKESFEEATWETALSHVADRLSAVMEKEGPQAVGFIGGSHATNEDLYAASRFFGEVVGTPHRDYRTFDAGFEPWALGDGYGSTATIDDLDEASVILWIGPDPREELPVLFLRLKAAAEGDAQLITVGSRRTSLDGLPGIHLKVGPQSLVDALEAIATGSGTEGLDASAISAIRESLDEGESVICAGQPFIGPDWSELTSAISSVVDEFSSKLLSCVPNANSQGAADMGLCPQEGGMGTTAMLDAAAKDRLKLLYIMGADVVSDIADAALVESALASDTFIVVSELFPTETARSADVILPAMASGEKEGSFTNLERRIQKLNPAVPAPGIARPDWAIMEHLASKFGADWGWESAADVVEHMASELSTHSGFSWEVLQESPGTLPTTVRRAGGSWPLQWELRAVDATRRRGWIWEADGAKSNGHGRPNVASRTEPTDEYPLVLLVARNLFDAGEMVKRSPELRGVTSGPFVEIHPEEAHKRGIGSGAAVTVYSAKGTTTAVLRVSDNTPLGCAFMPLNQPNLRTNVLMTAGDWSIVEVGP